MLARNFDVQLHIHPQWRGAKFVDGKWILGEKWNITDYKKSEIFKMVSASCEYLKGSFPKLENLVAFRGGSWGVAPFSSELVSVLKIIFVLMFR